MKYVNILKESFLYYFKYFYVVIGFAFNLAFAFLTLSKSFNLFVGNLSYTFFGFNIDLIFVLLVVLLSSFIYAFFNSLLIFLIRRDLQQGYYKAYLYEVLREHFLQLFLFLSLLNLFSLFVANLFIYFGIGFLGSLINAVVLFLLMFVPQSIIIDELGLKQAISLSYSFIKENPFKVLFVIIVVFLFYFILSLIAFYFNFGFIINFSLTHVFLLPFFEILKTVIYMTKYKIINSYF